MLINKSLIPILAAIAIMTLAVACGSSSSDTAAAAVYKVEYIPGTGMNASTESEGKTTFQLKITKNSDGSAAAGLAGSITLNPMMTGMGMNHSAPVDIVSESTTTAGTYDCTIYYLMGGMWQLDVTVGSETTTFSPSVASAAAGGDTMKKTVYGPSDIVSGMSGTQYNKYYLFMDDTVSAATPTFELYITQTKDNAMTFNPLSMISSPTGTVASAVVSASTDSTFATGTVTGTDDGNGHWYLSGISDLSTAGTYTVYVKLRVNNEDKTTTGAAPSMTNAAAFKVTSH